MIITDPLEIDLINRFRLKKLYESLIHSATNDLIVHADKILCGVEPDIKLADVNAEIDHLAKNLGEDDIEVLKLRSLYRFLEAQ